MAKIKDGKIRVEREDYMLILGILMFLWVIATRGIQWALDIFVTIFLSITIYAAIRKHIKEWEEED